MPPDCDWLACDWVGARICCERCVELPLCSVALPRPRGPSSGKSSIFSDCLPPPRSCAGNSSMMSAADLRPAARNRSGRSSLPCRSAAWPVPAAPPVSERRSLVVPVASSSLRARTSAAAAPEQFDGAWCAESSRCMDDDCFQSGTGALFLFPPADAPSPSPSSPLPRSETFSTGRLMPRCSCCEMRGGAGAAAHTRAGALSATCGSPPCANAMAKGCTPRAREFP
ncbi:hypothetical protein T484DRAFT_1955388 [Baffinella frigidus]|nr:hypothetical protein T484DRAFT_1955388 [Cryptophyta sp. CCMP2293]